MQSVYDGEQVNEPDVWWGPEGIDALIWADGVPYENGGGGA